MEQRDMNVTVPLQVMGLSMGYAAALSWLERKFPLIKPDHIWAEVAGGVLVTLLPVTLGARRVRSTQGEDLPWQAYEGAVWRAFCASGVPIILWQLGESILRHKELLSYNYTMPAQTRAATPAVEHLSDCSEDDLLPSKPGKQSAAHVQQHLRTAETSTAQAHAHMHDNPGLALVLMAQAHHAVVQALSCLPHTQKAVAKETAGEAVFPQPE